MKDTLNLLQIEVKAAEPAVKKSKLFYLFVSLGIYLVVIMSLWFLNASSARKLTAEIDKLNKQKMELQRQIRPSAPVSAPSPSVDKEILTAMEKAPRWSQILSTISVVVPQDVWLSSIESREEGGGRRMTFKGFSINQIGVANLISALELSRIFYDVEIVFIQKGAKDISFELKTKMRWT